MIHCHITSHLAMGMAAAFSVGLDRLPSLPPNVFPLPSSFPSPSPNIGVCGTVPLWRNPHTWAFVLVSILIGFLIGFVVTHFSHFRRHSETTNVKKMEVKAGE
jgi:hypothetical protein